MEAVRKLAEKLDNVTIIKKGETDIASDGKNGKIFFPFCLLR